MRRRAGIPRRALTCEESKDIIEGLMGLCPNNEEQSAFFAGAATMAMLCFDGAPDASYAVAKKYYEYWDAVNRQRKGWT